MSWLYDVHDPRFLTSVSLFNLSIPVYVPEAIETLTSDVESRSREKQV
jgi:hypothetical protein